MKHGIHAEAVSTFAYICNIYKTLYVGLWYWYSRLLEIKSTFNMLPSDFRKSGNVTWNVAHYQTAFVFVHGEMGFRRVYLPEQIGSIYAPTKIPKKSIEIQQLPTHGSRGSAPRLGSSIALQLPSRVC